MNLPYLATLVPPIPSPAFRTLLEVHIFAGLICVVTGAVALVSKKRRGRHPWFGRVYYASLSIVFVTMIPRFAATVFAALLAVAVRADDFKPEPGFVSLFNGKELIGWKTFVDQKTNWKITKGILIGSGANTGHIFTPRGDYKNFHLRVEARISDSLAADHG